MAHQLWVEHSRSDGMVGTTKRRFWALELGSSVKKRYSLSHYKCRSPSPLSTTSVNTASVDTAFLGRVGKLLDELIVSVGQLERRIATNGLQLEQQIDTQKLTGEVNEVRVIGHELLKRKLQSVNRGDEIQHMHASKEFVEALRSHRVGNISQFVLDLKKEVYKGDTTVLFQQVEKRVASAEKLDFIGQSERLEICEDSLERSIPKTETKSCDRGPHNTVTPALY